MSRVSDSFVDSSPDRRAMAAVRHGAQERDARVRRMSYFMLFRLAMLTGFTVLAGVMFYARPEEYDNIYAGFVWATLVAGYATTILFARMLPRVRDLDRFAAVQTSTDIVLAAVVVQMSGGVDSGFVTLYLIAVLGAATMGGPQHTWAAALACGVIYVVMSTLEFTEAVVPPIDDWAPLPSRAHWAAVARMLAGLIGVAVLSSYLNAQLATSVTEVGKLRALNENIVRSLNSGLVTVDMEGRLAYFNPTARSILGLDDADIGRLASDVLPGIQIGVGEERQELVLSTDQRGAVRIGLSSSPLVDESDEAVGHVINFQDLTRLHELAQRVRRNERLAALGGLAASVAHEIRNPLAAISGSAELLASLSLENDDARLLSVIRRESHRLSRLVDDLLAFTRPRPPQTRPVDLAQATREACDAIRTDPAVAEIGIHHEVRGDSDDEPPRSELDAAQLSQVLWNLLRNAAEALGGKGTITVVVTRDEDEHTIEVRDDGPGISPEHLERIFDPFFTTKEAGTGFGLAIAHRVVEDNGGTIACRSTLGEGSTFTLRFPRYDPLQPEDSGVLEL
jgi:two-component system sensor histidine kinase PilS (NtrC family)